MPAADKYRKGTAENADPQSSVFSTIFITFLCSTRAVSAALVFPYFSGSCYIPDASNSPSVRAHRRLLIDDPLSTAIRDALIRFEITIIAINI
jgi:hypothetical protein